MTVLQDILARHRAGDWSGAEAGWRAALAAAPDDASLHYYLADALHRQGRHKEAIEHYRQAIAGDPAILEAQFNLGCLLQESGADEEAVSRFQPVLAGQPDNLQVAARLCRVTRTGGHAAIEAEAILTAHRKRISGRAAHLLDAAYPELPEMRLLLEQFDRARSDDDGAFPALVEARLDPLVICRLYLFLAEFARTPPFSAPVLRLLLADTAWKGHRYILFQWVQQMIRMGLLRESPEHRQLSRQILDRFIEEYRPLLGVPGRVRHDQNRIAILSGHFRAVETHAVTSAVRDFAIFFRNNQGREVGIFATDPYEPFDAERHFCLTDYVFGRSVEDSSLADHLHDIADVWSIDPRLPRHEAISALIQQIVAFEPSLIVCVAAQHDLVRELLYEKYPILDIPVMDPLQPNRADAVFTVWPEILLRRMAEEACETTVPVARHFFASPLFWLPKTVTTPNGDHQTREALELAENQFVLVSVGTRLKYDLRRDFFARTCAFLQQAPDAVWLLAGDADLQLDFPELGDAAARVRLLPWVADLGALYKLCDAYLEPPRKGAATTTLIAAACGLPLVLDASSIPDVLPYLAEEDYVLGQRAYWERVELYHHDRTAARRAGERTRAGLLKRCMQRAEASAEWADILRQAAAAARAAFLERTIQEEP